MGGFAGLPPDVLLEDARRNATDRGFTLEAGFGYSLLTTLRSHWNEPGHSFEEARENTNRLILEAVKIAGTRGKESLDATTYNLVLASAGFCPLWPFC